MATISLRVHEDDLSRIDWRARELGMTRTAFMLKTVLGEVTADEQRLQRIEDRVARLEDHTFGLS